MRWHGLDYFNPLGGFSRFRHGDAQYPDLVLIALFVSRKVQTRPRPRANHPRSRITVNIILRMAQLLRSPNLLRARAKVCGLQDRPRKLSLRFAGKVVGTLPLRAGPWVTQL